MSICRNITNNNSINGNVCLSIHNRCRSLFLIYEIALMYTLFVLAVSISRLCYATQQLRSSEEPFFEKLTSLIT